MASFEERILAYLDGTLDQKEREDFLHTLSTSPEKREVLESHLRLQRLLTVVQKPVSAPLDVQRSLAGSIPAIGRRLPYLVGAPSEQQRNAFLLWWSNSRASFKIGMGIVLLSALAAGTYLASKPTDRVATTTTTPTQSTARTSNNNSSTAASSNTNTQPAPAESTRQPIAHPTTRDNTPAAPVRANDQQGNLAHGQPALTVKMDKKTDGTDVTGKTNRTDVTNGSTQSKSSISSISSNAPVPQVEQPTPAAEPTISLQPTPRSADVRIGQPSRTSIRFADPDLEEPAAHRLRAYAMGFGGATITRPFKLSNKMMQLGLSAMSTNAAFAGGCQVGLSYSFTPWLAVGGEFGAAPFARIQPFSYNESLDGYPFLTRHVYDSYIVNSSLPFARVVSSITFEPEYPVHAGLTGGVGLVFANSITPMGMLGLTVDWRMSSAFTIHSLVGISVASIAAEAPMGDSDPTASRFGVVHRDLGTGSLFNALPNVGVGFSYSPEF